MTAPPFPPAKSYGVGEKVAYYPRAPWWKRVLYRLGVTKQKPQVFGVVTSIEGPATFDARADRFIEYLSEYVNQLSTKADPQNRPYLPSDDPDDEGCARPDCPAGGGSGPGCVECAVWWDGENRCVREVDLDE